jgi:EAL domain-containing protein (putative c-di-GMP-specific phosphodiesterase class I)
VAEGIEREEEREALIGLGVEFGQGYLLGRPSFQVSSRPFSGHA